MFSTKTPMVLPLRQCCFYCAAVPPSGRRLHCNSRTAGWILATLKNTNCYGLNLPKLLGRPNSQCDCTWRQGLWGGGAGYMRSCRWVSNPTGLVPFKRRRHQQTSTLGSQSPREATQRPGSWLQARVRAFTRTSINRQLALRLPASRGVENKLLMPPSLQHFVMPAWGN